MAGLAPTETSTILPGPELQYRYPSLHIPLLTPLLHTWSLRRQPGLAIRNLQA